MNKKRFFIPIIIILIALVGISFSSCNEYVELGWTTRYDCEDVATLRNLFGKEFLYPVGDNVSDIVVKCKNSDSISEFLDDSGKLKNVIRIPQLIIANMNDKFEGIAIELKISKNNDDRKNWDHIQIDKDYDITVNGMTINGRGKAYRYQRNYQQLYSIIIHVAEGEEVPDYQFAYRYFMSLK